MSSFPSHSSSRNTEQALQRHASISANGVLLPYAAGGHTTGHHISSRHHNGDLCGNLTDLDVVKRLEMPIATFGNHLNQHDVLPKALKAVSKDLRDDMMRFAILLKDLTEQHQEAANTLRSLIDPQYSGSSTDTVQAALQALRDSGTSLKEIYQSMDSNVNEAVKIADQGPGMIASPFYLAIRWKISLYATAIGPIVGISNAIMEYTNVQHLMAHALNYAKPVGVSVAAGVATFATLKTVCADYEAYECIEETRQHMKVLKETVAELEPIFNDIGEYWATTLRRRIQRESEKWGHDPCNPVFLDKIAAELEQHATELYSAQKEIKWNIGVIKPGPAKPISAPPQKLQKKKPQPAILPSFHPI